MGTRRLSIDPVPPIFLHAAGEGSVQEIEVPAGETRYTLHQTGNEAAHYRFHLRQPGSKVLITGLIKAQGEETPSLTTETIHHTPTTLAETQLRTVAYGSAHPRYEGLIKIAPGAHGCESYLNHHSLLLGEQAKSWTRPSLEIQNNEVKCSHAATVRTVTKLDLFYLRSRGLSPEEATELLVDAFTAEVA